MIIAYLGEGSTNQSFVQWSKLLWHSPETHRFLENFRWAEAHPGWTKKGQREDETKGGCWAPTPLHSSGRKQVEGSATYYEEGKATQSKPESRGQSREPWTMIPRPRIQRFAGLDCKIASDWWRLTLRFLPYWMGTSVAGNPCPSRHCVVTAGILSLRCHRFMDGAELCPEAVCSRGLTCTWFRERDLVLREPMRFGALSWCGDGVRPSRVLGSLRDGHVPRGPGVECVRRDFGPYDLGSGVKPMNVLYNMVKETFQI